MRPSSLFELLKIVDIRGVLPHGAFIAQNEFTSLANAFNPSPSPIEYCVAQLEAVGADGERLFKV